MSSLMPMIVKWAVVFTTLTIRRELLFGLGLVVSPEEEDLYLCARDVLVNEAEDGAGEAVLDREASEQEKLPDNNESDTDSELSEAEIASSDEDMGEAVTSTKRMSIKAKQQPTVADKLHAIVVVVLRSEPRRKKMCQIIQKMCSTEHHHLNLICGMPIRWNTTLAEIERGILLQNAITFWVNTLPDGLQGKKRAAAVQKQAKLYIDPKGWQFLENLVEVLAPFKEFTSSLSQKKVPTLPQLLSLYKHLENHLTPNLQKALSMALAKHDKHMQILLKKKFPLLAAVLHPSIRLNVRSTDPVPGVLV
ncbi:hypothetical protein BC835DRAFT_1310610 [Cytidiella melzeri]|nr:hypothetical protein BC835DRAFT_1310610 [Cytidiella melzeri]